MRIKLEGVDARMLELDIPIGKIPQRITIANTQGLRGELETGAVVELSDVTAERLALAALELAVGAVNVAGAQGAQFERARFAGRKDDVGWTFELHVGELRAPELSVAMQTIDAHARLLARGVTLTKSATANVLRADEIELVDAGVRWGSWVAKAAMVRVHGLRFAWGAGVLEIGAQRIEVESSELVHRSLQLQSERAAVADLRFDGFVLECSRWEISRSGAEFSLASEEAGDAPGPERTSRTHAASEPPPRPPDAPEGSPAESSIESSIESSVESSIDLGLLDGLSGHVHVDVEADLTVPVIGRRRATHRFRIPIAAGVVNFRELEDDLSTLENSLIDFAVREGHLVLERGIPLLPTRGFGKPIVAWPLSPTELALAERDRVRLAALAQPRLVQTDGKSDEPAVAVRELGFENIDVALRLESIDRATGVLGSLAFEGLRIAGSVGYRPAAPQPGRVSAQLQALRTRLVELGIAGVVVDTHVLELRDVESVQVWFEGIRPRALQVQVAHIGVERLRIVREV